MHHVSRRDLLRIGSLGLMDSDANMERIRQLDDKVRGGPPVLP